MATEVRICVTLVPVGEPWVAVSTIDTCRRQQLTEPTKFEFEYMADCVDQFLSVRHFGKNNQDPNTAVIVKDVGFFGISDPKFVWQGRYCPEYPEPWLSQQWPRPKHTLTNVDYLGWNGTWTLQFTAPVFTWIHQVQNLGWIHP